MNMPFTTVKLCPKTTFFIKLGGNRGTTETDLEAEVVEYWREVLTVRHGVMYKLYLSLLRPLF